mmetsp:Transcript_395/g.945  ORF Transcript_395/g.945 Transcript_395/m.945 type:complete len:236 (-) Transcript_395:77-784(-)|eukprot:CAMPEP_0116869454 /NCGR_PEP_ID=MMETSP0418-20121206/27769_1 /TAXON_ID=1158023 /ORGANISM="Astrosyne radiata, Strain 13vi08-1A" /LENGTH=235 /DNA_ID=CAMNT_0004505553 /DNA_START=336 /DNA_END=1043 /DNA_ORIENTATION=-
MLDALVASSASYGGKKEWRAAAEDAKECIRLEPSFVKGYYRLVSAHMELRDWDAAMAATKQGLSIEPNNPQLLKQQQNVKQAKKKLEKAAAAAAKKAQAAGYRPQQLPLASGGDAAVNKELQDLQEQYVRTTRELNTVKANIVHAQRESKANEITKSEIDKLPSGGESRIYRGVGKMFMLSTKDEVMEHLTDTIEKEKKRETDLSQKMEYLERQLKSQEQNISELAKSGPSSAAE